MEDCRVVLSASSIPPLAHPVGARVSQEPDEIFFASSDECGIYWFGPLALSTSLLLQSSHELPYKIKFMAYDVEIEPLVVPATCDDCGRSRCK